MTKRILSMVLMVAFFAVSAEAKLISTEAVMADYGVSAKKQEVLAFFERGDVVKHLESLGVNPEAAKVQVSMMTDEQIAKLSQKIDELPAGGDILGIALFVFIVLLVTDILGVTKIFPFTKPIR